MPVWVFSKADDIRNLFKVSKEIIVVNFSKQIKINPLLPPPGVEVPLWINCFCDLFIQAFGLYDGTKNFLIDNLTVLFQKNSLPTIHDLYRYVKSLEFPLLSRTARYQESAVNRISGIINTMGDVWTYPCINMVDLVKRHAIFEISKLYAELQVFMVNLLLSWLFYYKLHCEIAYRHIIGIDDANLVFDISFERRPDRGIPDISHLLSTVRKSSTHVIVNTQIPHQVGASIHSNAFTKIVFSLANGKDIDCMVRSIGIRERDQLDYCYKLGKREIIVKFAGRYPLPFLAYISEVNAFKDHISDDEVNSNNARIIAGLTLIKQSIRPLGDRSNKPPGETTIKISPNERAFLWDIYNRPYVTITERYDTISLRR